MIPGNTWLPDCKCHRVSDEHQTEGGGASRRGRGGFKDREDQSIGDPFRVSGAEFLSTALANSCQAAVWSDAQRETVGLEEERSSRDAQTLTGQWSESETGISRPVHCVRV